MPVSAEKQLERRRKILACTRDLINEVGYENLNVRDLAKRCGVSVPTLYNQFRSKDNLVYTAAAEIYQLHLDKMKATCTERGLDRLIYQLSFVDDMIKRTPRLSRLLINVTPSKSGAAEYAERLYTQAMVEMAEDGELVPWVDPVYIGNRIFAQIRAVHLEWSHGGLTDEEFVRARHTDTFVMLLGITQGTTQKRLETMLRKELSASNTKRRIRKAS